MILNKTKRREHIWACNNAEKSFGFSSIAQLNRLLSETGSFVHI